MLDLNDLANRLVPYLTPSFLSLRTGYKEGSWTPVFAGTTTAGTYTYTAQTGVYTRIGNQVIAHGRIAISAIGVAPVGNMRITGLPLAAANAGVYGSVVFSTIHNFNYTNTAFELTGRIPVTATYIELVEAFDNAGAQFVPAANFTNAACELDITAIYQV